MSYDIALYIDTGGKQFARVTEMRNPTYNLHDMFALALGCRIRDLQDRKAAECIPVLQAAIRQMRRTPARFKKLNPSNGWGDYEGALNTLDWLLEECLQHPKATVYI